MFWTYCLSDSAIPMMALIALRPKSNLTTEAYCIRTFAVSCTLQIFLARVTAFLKPLAYSRISVINTASGTTMEMDLNKFFKSMGSSVLPA